MVEQQCDLQLAGADRSGAKGPLMKPFRSSAGKTFQMWESVSVSLEIKQQPVSLGMKMNTGGVKSSGETDLKPEVKSNSDCYLNSILDKL